ncbi:ADP-ribose pyrophosphatase YjhB (NUDIX family) [Nocardioides albertanoniae]|uniref:ADP-ribose pyrophosphatase YjhB (NUDIX family) n=1 Tax=Nocardioides albertanoniae TaxID=1175486 RepID=A0A543A4K2_9ACTN|nr:NUDIX hydrolase [Nocardioides albertanoniae]TQL67532.1 ADP-ribose pyrophosphatase YjhB (NUDIX family) [Nocardioides albertanoniae]
MNEPETTTVSEGVARIEWAAGEAVDVVRREVAAALLTHHRVEALVDPGQPLEQRTATWSGLHREGLLRGVAGGDDRMLYARVASDAPVEAPEGFRALLNSFLPRKRAIGQMLVRDPDGRVLMCQLTYKKDWDLPGGIVEVGESPRLATSREIEEELDLEIPADNLLLTDWLPPWGGWDDAVCLVFDGGVHPPSILERTTLQPREIRSVAFCTIDEVRERAADFTARRVEAALAALDGGPGYTESGRA